MPWPITGALASLLRLKGFAWLATVPKQQVLLAMAGTQFTVKPGPAWFAVLPLHMWPEERPDGFVWDKVHGDRRTELVCIGRELDRDAVWKQLESCLLTAEEYQAGAKSWPALPDPLTPRRDDAHSHSHEHEHRPRATRWCRRARFAQ